MIITKSYINLVIGGRSRTVEASNKFFPQLLDAVKNQAWEAVDTLSDLAQAINKAGAGKVVVEDGVVFYDGMPVHNIVATRILDMLAEGWTVDPMIKFLENLLQNPVASAIDELYLFMEANSLPLTPDGHFLAYKVVTSNFKDKQTKTFDNSVGAVLDMDRAKCDLDRNNHCSSGFHFCGFSYLCHFGSADDQIMIVKVNPKDVTSIPSDYQNAKGRACHYVIQEHYGKFSDFFEVDRLATAAVTETSEIEFLAVEGNPIRSLRELLGFSQREVAEYAGYSKSTLWNAEQISNTPKVETMDRWAQAMTDLRNERDETSVRKYTFKIDEAIRIMIETLPSEDEAEFETSLSDFEPEYCEDCDQDLDDCDC
jgi:transcriptional regulator with XRE-family HTH domain